MVIFIKKIKAKEGINIIDTEKIKKDIPTGYKPAGEEPAISVTARNVMVAYKCVAAPVVKAKPRPKAKTKSKKAVAAKA